MLIHKEILRISREPFNCYLPENSTILDAQLQDNEIALWYNRPDVSTAIKIRTFVFHTTGNSKVLPNHKYIATIQVSSSLVVHLFEVL